MSPIRLPAPPQALKKRLLTVGPVPPEWGGKLRGGVTRFNVTLLEELRTRPWRHRIEPVGVLIPPPQRIHRLIAERLAPMPIFMQPEGGRPRRFTRLLIDEQRPDVVLVNNIAAFNGARYVRVQAAVAPELPTIAVVHEWRAIRAKDDEREAERYRAAAQAALDHVAAVVFPSRHTRDLGREQLGLRYPERALVIHNPVGPAFADPELGIDGARRGIAFVGSFNDRKNPQSLLRALPALPDVSLTLQGRGPIEEDLKTDEIAARQRCRLGNRVLLPRLGAGDAANCQENCDGGAQLSGRESHAGRGCTTHTAPLGCRGPLIGLPARALRRAALYRAPASALRSIADRLDDGFHVAQVSLERTPAGAGQPVLRLDAGIRCLLAGDVLGFFQLARVDAQVSVCRLQQPFEIVECQPLVDRQRSDDPKP